MIRATITTLFLLAVVITAGAQQPDWIKYASAEGRYEVNLPNQPQLSAQDSKRDAGGNVKQYLALAGSGNHGFMVAYYDYEVNQAFSLDKARDGMIASIKATLLREDQISLGGSPGRQMTLGVNVEGADYVDLVRVYDANRRVYLLQCLFPKDEQSTTEITDNCNKFFDSFKIMK